MISGCLALIVLLIILIILFAIASTLFYLGLIVSFIFLCYKTYQDYKLYKETGVASNKLKLECGAIIAIFIIFLIGVCNPDSNNSNNTDTSVVSSNNDSRIINNNDSNTDNDSNANKQAESNSIWKEHDLSNSIVYVYNDNYAIMITDISKVQDCIKLTYTFINESNDATSALWNFHCVPYQNGINLDDNKEYSNHYYECGNEQTNIKPGVSIDNCWELIPIGDGSDIEIEMSIGLWSNAQSTITINPNTLEYTINNK